MLRHRSRIGDSAIRLRRSSAARVRQLDHRRCSVTGRSASDDRCRHTDDSGSGGSCISATSPSGDTVTLNGGTLRFDNYDRDSAGTFNFFAGTIQLAGNRTIGTDAAITELFGAAPTLTTGKGLTVEGTATLLTAVTLDGGTFTAGQLVNGHRPATCSAARSTSRIRP